jgi:NADPH-dependent curcumin reductase CurA
MDKHERALAELQGWVAAGKIKVKEDIMEGLENTPKALIGLLAGDNVGKRMVKVS